ncbi:capsid protein [Genomoviridae sp.]|nr:capsid protein [Genomoviridae sp.]
MAYLRKRRYTRRRSGSSKGRKTIRRSAPRSRSTGKTRRFTPKRRMSKRAILNTSSRKKRNTMLSWANTSTTNGASVTVGPGPLVVNGSTGYFGIFCPTAMDLSTGNGLPNYFTNVAERTSTTCYMRGYAENLRIQTGSGLPWFWRRITFAAKSDDFLTYAPGETGLIDTANPSYVDTSNGMERVWKNQLINNATNTLAVWRTIIFKGAQDKDWSDLLTAPIDTTRVDLKSDSTQTIRSGNANGTVRLNKRWYHMNKNLTFDDDESGEVMTQSYQSVQDKRGMGDYFIWISYSPVQAVLALI